MKKMIVGCLLLGLFLFLGISMHQGANWVHSLDQAGNDLLRNVISPNRTSFFKVMTHFGDAVTVVALGLVVTFIIYRFKSRELGTYFFATLLIGGGLAPTLLKLVFRRERPADKLIPESGFSFPSGHATGSMVLYGLLILIAMVALRHFLMKMILILVSLALLLLVGWSRVYLGVHYPTDILGGFLLGLSLIFISWSLYRRSESGRRRRYYSRRP